MNSALTPLADAAFGLVALAGLSGATYVLVLLAMRFTLGPQSRFQRVAAFWRSALIMHRDEP